MTLLEARDGWKLLYDSICPGCPEWFVHRRVSDKQTIVYGPYQSADEAMKESGMPKPKTELEEVWEVAGHMKTMIGKAASSGNGLYLADAGMRFDALSRKYNKP